jgi:hypothetical protein
METSILIMIIVAIVLIFLIFKFIKKMIFAVISAILVVSLLFGGVIGIAVYDIKTLSEKTDFDVSLAYFNENDYIFGLTLPIKDSNISQDELKKLSESDFNKLDYKNLDKNGNNFVIKLDRQVLENLINLNSFTPSFFESLELPKGSDLSITKKQTLDLFESQTIEDSLITLLLEENNVDPSSTEIIKAPLVKELKEGMSDAGVTTRQILFFELVMNSIDKNKLNYLELLSSYKNKKIEIYPNRLTFSLVKMLPSSFVQKQIESVTVSNEVIVE